MSKQWIVVLVQPAPPTEAIYGDALAQINEVFGPFPTEEDADNFITRAQERITYSARWLLSQLSDDFTVQSKPRVVCDHCGLVEGGPPKLQSCPFTCLPRPCARAKAGR